MSLQNPVSENLCNFPPQRLQLIGSSLAMQDVAESIRVAGEHQFPVLIVGESGTGKELAANIIHNSSRRRTRPFVPVDCAALVPTLIESELFGHVRGAFTGAQCSRIGLLEAGDGGTVFLDEIGELPLHCQAKLLRALQEHEIRPVGATRRVRINLRIIAATNRNLEAEVKAGRFRGDLYFRLNVLPLRMPALRAHKSDIPLLVDAFLVRCRENYGSNRCISAEAMRCLMDYDWPGNVRELEHAIEHALASGGGNAIEVDKLPSAVRNTAPGRPLPEEDEFLPLEDLQRRAIFSALDKTKGDKLAAARLLQIGKTTLYRKLKEYGASESSNNDGLGLPV